jgi:predicted transcriptional regulator
MVRTGNVTARNWKAIKAARLSPDAAARVAGRARDEVRAFTLKELRQELAVTQVALAAAADMTQSELSRLESRFDHRVSSLRRYVEALGGEIEITAVIGDRRVKLTDV